MPPLKEQMLADALAAQKFTRKYFVVELNFTLASVQELESQFDAIRYALRGGATPENRRQLSQLWGAYLGEILCRHAGAEWISIEENGTSRSAVRIGSSVLFPHERVEQRIDGGPTFNVDEWIRQAIAT